LLLGSGFAFAIPLIFIPFKAEGGLGGMVERSGSFSPDFSFSRRSEVRSIANDDSFYDKLLFWEFP
jgi:hypothetical protein